MFCPQCGNEIPDSATFCSTCGNQLKRVRKHAAATAKARRIALYICVGVLALIMVAPESLVTYTYYDSSFRQVGEPFSLGFLAFLVPPNFDLGAGASLVGMGLVIAGIVLELRKKNASTTLFVAGFALMFFGFQFLQSEFQWYMYTPDDAAYNVDTVLCIVDSGGAIEAAQFFSLLALVLVLVGRLGVGGTFEALKDRLDDDWEFLRSTNKDGSGQ